MIFRELALLHNMTHVCIMPGCVMRVTLVALNYVLCGFAKVAETIMTLHILPIVLGFVCIQMLVVVSAYRSDLTVSNTHDFSVAAVSGGDDSELARHRRQGHIPFNPNCLECAKGRSVFQHRRDKGDRKEVSIQANFAFLNTTGEIVADELPGSVKILVLTEMMSRCIGYVVVGEDVEAARRQIVVWLQHFA